MSLPYAAGVNGGRILIARSCVYIVSVGNVLVEPLRLKRRLSGSLSGYFLLLLANLLVRDTFSLPVERII